MNKKKTDWIRLIIIIPSGLLDYLTPNSQYINTTLTCVDYTTLKFIFNGERPSKDGIVILKTAEN
jgi:hypothetical protein